MEQLINFETAKSAKEKGFNQPTKKNYFLKYPENGKLKDVKIILDDNDWVYYNHHRGYDVTIEWEDFAFAPTQSELQKWLRDNHNIHIEIELASDEELNILIPYVYQFSVYKDGKGTFDREFYEKYEETLEVSLNKSLELI